MSGEALRSAKNVRHRDRRPDSQLISTIESVRAQRDFKRMLIFGLRTVSELCEPNTSKMSVDNAYVCIEQSFVGEMKTILEKHPNDLEIIGLLAKILEGISNALMLEPDAEAHKSLYDQGLVALLSDLIFQAESANAPPPPASTWESLTKVVKNSPQILTNPKAIEATLHSLEKEAGYSWYESQLVLATWRKIVSRPPTSHPSQTKPEELMEVLKRGQGAEKILRSAVRLCERGEKRVFGTEAVDILSEIDQPFEERGAAEPLVRLIELHSHVPHFQTRAARLLATLMGKSELQQVLSKVDQESLSVLAALSHVPEFADQWAASGGVPSLCNVLRSCASSSSESTPALVGALSMLNTVAATQGPQLVSHGCTDAAMTLLKREPGPDVHLLAQLLKLLNSLAGYDPSVSPSLLGATNAVDLICAKAVTPSPNEELQKSGLKLLCTCIAQQAVASTPPSPTIEQNIQKCHKAIATLLESYSRQRKDPENVVDMLTCLSVRPRPDLLPGVINAVHSLTGPPGDTRTAEIALRLIGQCGGEGQPEVTEAILDAALKFHSQPSVTRLCQSFLDSAAQESDLVKALATVSKCAASPKGKSSELIAALAAVNGFTAVARLENVIAKHKVEETLHKAVTSVIGVTPFGDQQEVFKASLDCLIAVHERVQTSPLSDESATTPLCLKLLNLANGHGIKNAVAAQQNNVSNSLLDLLDCAHQSTRGKAVVRSNAEALQVFDAIGSLMRRFPEQKKALIECLHLTRAILTHQSEDPSEQAAYVKSGLAKQQLALLQKALVFEDFQRAGLACVLECAERQPQTSRDVLRSAGAMEVARAAARAHPNKPEIQRLHAQLAQLLTPADVARQEVLECLRQIQQASSEASVETAMTHLAELTAAPDAAKHAVHHGLGPILVNLNDDLMRNNMSSVLMVLRNVAAVGKPHSSTVLKAGILKPLQAQSLHCPAALDVAGALLAHEDKHPLSLVGGSELRTFVSSDEACPSGLGRLVCRALLATPASLENDEKFKRDLRQDGVSKMEQPGGVEETLRSLIRMFMLTDPTAAAELARIFTEAGGCDNALRLMDSSGSSEECAMLARELLQRVCHASADGADLRRALIKRGGAGAIFRVCKAFGRNLGNCGEDSIAAISTLSMLSALTTRMDRTDLTSLGLDQVVQQTLEANPDCQPLQAVVGQLLNNLGAPDQLAKLFAQVIHLLSQRPPNFQADLLTCLEKLQIFINAGLAENDLDESSFRDGPRAIQLLTAYLSDCKSDAKSLDAILLVAKRLAQTFDGFESSYNSNSSVTSSNHPYGLQSLVQAQLANKVISLITANDPATAVRRATPFLRDSYSIMYMLCQNNNYSPDFKGFVRATDNFLADTWVLFERYAKDPQVATPIIQFIGHFASDPECYDALEEARKVNKLTREMGADAETAVLRAVANLRKSKNTVGEGLAVVGALMTRRKDLSSSGVMKKENLQAAKEMAKDSEEGLAGYAAMARQLLNTHGQESEEILELALDALSELVRRWKAVKDDPTVSTRTKQNMVRELAELSTSLAKKSKFMALRQHEIPSLLTEAAKICKDRSSLVKVVQTFQAASPDKELCDVIVTQALPMLVNEGNPLITSDTDCAETSLTLFRDRMRADAAVISFVKDLNGVDETLEGVMLLTKEYPDRAQSLVTLINEIRSMLNDQSQEPLTLEQIYRRWDLRKQNGQQIALCNQNAGLMNEFNFVVDKTEEYSVRRYERADEELGREFSFGCLCFGLIHENVAENEQICCVEAGEQKFFMSAMGVMQPMELVQYIVMGNIEAVRALPDLWAVQPKAAEITVNMVKRGATELSGMEKSKAEALLIQRLEFMELLCSKNRSLYNDTAALKVLISIWNLVDDKSYSIAVLRAAVRVLRAMINDHWADQIIELGVCNRLLDVVDADLGQHELQADALFCLGTMAALVKLKTHIGIDNTGIERIVALLKRNDKKRAKCLKSSSVKRLTTDRSSLRPSQSHFAPTTEPDKNDLLQLNVSSLTLIGGVDRDELFRLSRVQQNACLTLGNLVLGHGANSNAFGNNRGVDLVVGVLKSALAVEGAVDYELANAACVLMCNVSYKREDFKEALGKGGAPTGIMTVLERYDGGKSVGSERCVASVMKAITNLSLAVSNVGRFLEGSRLTDAMLKFYGSEPSDALVLDSLRTLSNLTLENSEEFMTQFGRLSPALLNLLEKRPGSELSMLAFSFETFAALCRLPANLRVFLDNRGVEILLHHLNSQRRDEGLYEQALALAAVLARNPEAASRLVDAGFFKFVLELLDDCEHLEDPQLLVTALKVIRRMVQTSEGANTFIQASPINLLCDVLTAAAENAQADATCVQTAVESLRILLQLLHLHPPPNGTEVDTSAPVVTQAPDIADQPPSKSKSFSQLFRSRQSFFLAKKTKTSTQDQNGDSTPDRTPDRLQGIESAASSRHDTTTGEDDDDLDDADAEEELGSPVALDSPPPHDTLLTRTTTEGLTSVLYKPKGQRSWEIIGIDCRKAHNLCRALFAMLVDSEGTHLKSDHLTEFSLVLLAYFVAEKLDGVSLALLEDRPNALGQFVVKAFCKEQNKVRLTHEATEFLANTLGLIASDDLRTLSDNKLAMNSLKTAHTSLSSKEAPLKNKIQEIYALLNMPPEALVPNLFYPLATYHFPLTSSDFNHDAYPNGVQDLDTSIRKKLRRGGKCGCLSFDENNKPVLTPCYWRSSSDLTEFHYMTDRKLQNYDFHIPFARLRRLERGINGSQLAIEHAKTLKLRPSTTVSFVVSPCLQQPNGAELVLVFTNRLQCSRFFSRVQDWQEAATM